MTRRSTRTFNRIIHSSNRRRGAAGDTSLTYEGAYINRSGETNGSNKTISLKFSEAVPTGSNYTTGMTIEVTGDNGSNYVTLDLGDTTQAVVNTNYVQYTLTGTVDTFQGLSGTEGHQVRISYDGSQSWNGGTITNVTTLNNASTINMLDSAKAGWTFNETSGTRVDVIGNNDLTDNNTVGYTTGVADNAADLEADNSESLSITDNADLSMGDIAFEIFIYVKPESTPGNYIFSKWNSNTGSHREYFLELKSNGKFEFEVTEDGTSSNRSTVDSDTFGAASTGTFYHTRVWHDPVANIIGVAVWDTVTEQWDEDTVSHSGGVFDGPTTFFFGLVNGNSGYFDGAIDSCLVRKKLSSVAELSFMGEVNADPPYLPDYT